MKEEKLICAECGTELTQTLLLNLTVNFIVKIVLMSIWLFAIVAMQEY